MKTRNYIVIAMLCSILAGSTGCAASPAENESSMEVQTEALTASENPDAGDEKSSEEDISLDIAATDSIPETTDIPDVAESETVIEIETESDAESETNANNETDAETEAVGVGVLDGIKIGLDPGHQEHANTDPETIAPGSSETKFKVTGGAVGVSTGIPEYITVLEISQLLRDKLEAEGATVYMTRESHDVDISNQERTKMMNEYGVDLMLRIHCDSAENPSASGTALYVSATNAIAGQSRQYAETILPIVVESTGSSNNGIIQNDNYTGQNWAEVPCIMIECGFLSNPDEDLMLNNPEYQEELTDGICKGIIACFE